MLPLSRQEDLPSGVHREEPVSRLKKLLEAGLIVAVTGPRRAGKSFILRQAAKDLAGKVSRSDMLIVNLEDPRFMDLDVRMLEAIFKTYREALSPRGTPYVFLDEVQAVPGWERWVRYMQELGKARMTVSGSNAEILSPELGTLLTGRHLDLNVFPLSLRELLAFRESAGQRPPVPYEEWSGTRAVLRDCMEYGSFPEVVLSERKKEILLSYFADITDKDIIRRFKLRKPQDLHSMAKFYLTNVACATTFRSVARHLGVSVETVEKFSGCLEQAYLLFFLKRFSFKVREQEKSPRKVYAVDAGLANAMGFRFSENPGRLAENLVHLELRRRQAADSGIELYYWKDREHREVDFVLKEGPAVSELIQVCWDVSDPRTKAREAKNLLRAMAEVGEAKATVITDSHEETQELDGRDIRYQPLWKWLLAR